MLITRRLVSKAPEVVQHDHAGSSRGGGESRDHLRSATRATKTVRSYCEPSDVSDSGMDLRSQGPLNWGPESPKRALHTLR